MATLALHSWLLIPLVSLPCFIGLFTCNQYRLEWFDRIETMIRCMYTHIRKLVRWSFSQGREIPKACAMLIKEKEVLKGSLCTVGGFGIIKNASHGYNAYWKTLPSHYACPVLLQATIYNQRWPCMSKGAVLVLLTLIIVRISCCLEICSVFASKSEVAAQHSARLIGFCRTAYTRH
jgi:hypothetical protein